VPFGAMKTDLLRNSKIPKKTLLRAIKNGGGGAYLGTHAPLCSRSCPVRWYDGPTSLLTATCTEVLISP